MVLEGYMAREEEEWDRTRTILAYLKTYGGMGASQATQPTEIMTLQKDLADRIKPIKTYDEAIELLHTFNTI